jgi:hypothetical protein
MVSKTVTNNSINLKLKLFENNVEVLSTLKNLGQNFLNYYMGRILKVLYM